MTRRDFIEQTGAGLLASGVATAASAADSVIPIIDTHQHLWDLDRFELPWLGGAPRVLRKTYLTKEYREATQGLSVSRAVYMEVNVAARQQADEADFVVGLCRSGEHPTVAAVVSGRPESDGFAAAVARYRDHKYVKGLRRVLHDPEIPAGLCLEKTFVRSVNLLGEMNLSFDLCMRPFELTDAIKLADACRGTRLILDHCGNADPKAFLPAGKQPEKPWHNAADWRRDLAELAKRPNVWCKISGIVARAPEGWNTDLLAPIVNHCLDSFGPDRVFFGGDWPVCLLGATFGQWVTALRDILRPRSEADQRKLLHDNAVRFYGLS